jgi:nucleotide-binding universal stress UspA family protein
LEKTLREIDEIAAEFHGTLPRDKAGLIGAIYARYSSRHEDSIADQVRKCFEAAVQKNTFVPREFICFDLAVRGYKRQRAGLDQLQALLEYHSVKVLLVFATNRLFRKTYRSLQFVEEEVVGRGIRCIFVTSKLDTMDSERWQMLLQFHGIMDELVVGMYADHGQFEELRIVSEELWYGAQKRLAENVHANAGRKPRDGDRKFRPRLLNGLFYCAEHKQQLHVGGAFGKSMYCPVCKRLFAKQRPLYSLLNRELAVKLTCDKLADIIRFDTHLVEEIIAACQKEAKAAQKPDHCIMADKTARLGKVNRQIQFLLDNPGETDEDRKESAEKLKLARCERSQLSADLGLLQAAGEKSIVVPNVEEVRVCIYNLDKILGAAAVVENHDETLMAREVIKMLTEGRIEVVQQGERQRRQGWLQGRFKVSLVSCLVNRLTEAGCRHDGAGGIDVGVDFRGLKSLDIEATRAKEMYDRGQMNCQIANELGCGRNWVTKLIEHWFMSRRLPVPDGRSRRSTLPKKQSNPVLYEQLAEEVTVLWDQGLADIQIAAQLGCSPRHMCITQPRRAGDPQRRLIARSFRKRFTVIGSVGHDDFKDARLIVLHVASFGRPVPYEELERMLKESSGYRRELEDKLRQCQKPECNAEFRVEEGDPAARIIHGAQEAKCDLIVMGTHSRTGIPHLLIGSVTEKTLRHAPCPVLLVKHPVVGIEASPKRQSHTA